MTRACSECGAATKAAREPYRYTLAGGWAATVENVLVYRCPKCGASEVSIEKMSPLQRAIVGAILVKPSRLAGEEITCLRSHLGLSGRDLARTMGVTPAALSRWEQNRDPIGGVSDRALRMLVALEEPGRGLVTRETLAAIDGGDGKPLRLVARLLDGVWFVDATNARASAAA